MSSDDYKEQRRNRQKELARKYIMSDEVDQVALEELNRLCKPIYLYIYSGYHIKLPHIDKDDYILMGYITLWKVLERCRKNPDIINNFSAYLFRSIRNAYAAEFRNIASMRIPFIIDNGRLTFGKPKKPVFIIAHAIIIVHVFTLEYPLDLQNKKDITIHIILTRNAAKGNNIMSELILAVDKFTKINEGKLTVKTMVDKI